MWREMKAGAQSPFREDGAGTQTLSTFFQALRQSDKPKIIHMVGHSTGMILLTYLLERLQQIEPALKVKSTSFMAPAGDVGLFTTKLQPLLKLNAPNFHISRMNIYNLNDALEQDDDVGKIYNKSLLYLVSRSFEESLPERLLGMEKCADVVSRRAGLSRLKFYYSDGESGSRVTTSTTHGGFDNDLPTMNHILENIVGGTPARKFTQQDLEY